MNSFDLPSYSSNSRKKCPLRILPISLEEGGVLKVVLPGKEANNLLWGRKGLPAGPGVRGNYMN